MNRARLLALLLPVVALLVGAMKKPDLTIRFYVEANSRDSDTFAAPIQLQNPPRSTYIEKTASISEHDITEIEPYATADGTWGCLLKLDHSGALRLEELSMRRVGTSIVVFIGTKTGNRQVIDMQIDRRVGDGIIPIQRGLTAAEIELMKKHFKQPRHPEAATEHKWDLKERRDARVPEFDGLH